MSPPESPPTDEFAPRVSVIVAFRDAEETLARCLGAVCAQRLGNRPEGHESFEVLAVDNGSRDRSASIASALVGEHPHLRLLSERRSGAYHARNHGVAEARSEVLVFTDADCVPVEGWLERIVGAVQSPGARVVMGRDRPGGASRCVRLLGLYDHCKEALVLSGVEAEFYYGHTNNLATTRSTLAEVGGFDPRPRGADVIFVQQVLARHGTSSVRYEPAAEVEHLEIESAWVYYRKAVIYGRSARRYSKVVPARPLTAGRRWRSFLATVESGGLGLSDRALLLLLLTVGALAYQWGWMAERWTRGVDQTMDASPGGAARKPRSLASQDPS